MQRCRNLAADRAVRTDIAFLARLVEAGKQLAFKHPDRNFRFKLSMKALSVGMPGRLKSNVTPSGKPTGLAHGY
jgi:hypothetical protein